MRGIWLFRATVFQKTEKQCAKNYNSRTELYSSLLNVWYAKQKFFTVLIILVPRGRDPFGRHQESILTAEQKDRGLWGRECVVVC